MTHLTDDLYGRLTRGELPPEDARALARHLETECQDCEAYLAGRNTADALDGAVDTALEAAAPARGEAGNDLEFQRIRRRVADAPAAAVRARPWRRFAVAAVAAVAVAGLSGVVLRGTPSQRPAWDGEKGMRATRAPSLRLRFLVVGAADGAPVLEKGIPGQAVPATASLQFEVEVGRPTRVVLLHVPSRGAAEVFYEAALPAGRSAVSVDGRPAAFPLAGLAGEQRFVALASDSRLGPEILAAARALDAPPAVAEGEGAGPDLEGIAAVVTKVVVQ